MLLLVLKTQLMELWLPQLVILCREFGTPGKPEFIGWMKFSVIMINLFFGVCSSGRRGASSKAMETD